MSSFKDPNIKENALRILEKRYFWTKADGTLEDAKEMFWRVSAKVASAEALFGSPDLCEIYEQVFMEMMCDLRFMPNTPTLTNAGREKGQLAACYVLPISDSMEGIMDCLKAQAMVQKSGGGTGFNYGDIRERDALIKSTGKRAVGPIPVIKLKNYMMSEFIIQGGTRLGANMGVLPIDHPDIEEFITFKREDGSCKSFNISPAVPDAFMEAVQRNGTWDLISRVTKQPKKTISAVELFNKICQNAWETGDPGMLFIDAANRSNPTPNVGRLEATNPCVSGDTLISTDRGLERIREFVSEARPDALVLGQNGQWRKVKEFQNNGVKTLYQINLRSGYAIQATEYHQFPVVDKIGLKKLSELTIGDKLHLQSHRSKFAKSGLLDIDSAELLGWMIGDGYLSKLESSKSGGLIVGKMDKNLLPFFTRIIEQVIGVKPGIYERPEYSTVQLLHNRLWKWMVQDLGILPKKASEKVVPEIIFTQSEDAIKAFIRGLFSADGKVVLSKKNGGKGNSDCVVLTSKSRKLLSDVQILLSAFGQRTSILNRSRKPRSGLFKHTKKNGLTVEYGSDGVCWELFLYGKAREFFISEIGFTKDSYKICKLNKLSRDVDNNYTGFGYIDEIISISEIGKDAVYDVFLEDPTDLTYMCNGIVSWDCGEQWLLPNEACTLGHLNLGKYYIPNPELNGSWESHFNWKQFKTDIRNGVRFLDNVIEVNYYALPEIEQMHRHTNRKIGLGVMGEADLFIKLGVAYDSQEALKIAHTIAFEFRKSADQASRDLGAERGSFKAFSGSQVEAEGWDYMRNACRCTVAPTGSTAIIVDSSTSIEPVSYLILKREQAGMTMYEVYPPFKEYLDSLPREDAELVVDYYFKNNSIQGCPLIDKSTQELFKQANDISVEGHIRMQATWQMHIDNSISKTINMPNSSTVEDVKNAYMLAWKLDCKGITVYRDGCRANQALSAGIAKESTKKFNPFDRNPQINWLTDADVKILSGEPAPLKILVQNVGVEEPTQEDIDEEERSMIEVVDNPCPECHKQLDSSGGCDTCKHCGYAVCHI